CCEPALFAIRPTTLSSRTCPSPVRIIRRLSMRRSSVILLLLFLLLTVVSSVAQQDFVSRYDAFGGYSYLSSPKLDLSQNGFHTQFGVNATSWVALGADFSYFNGNSTLHTTDLNSTQLAKLAPIAPLLPPGFVIQSPYDA